MLDLPPTQHSTHEIIFIFTSLLFHLGSKLSRGGLQNEWLAQGLLLDSSDPQHTGCATTNVCTCACLCVCVLLRSILVLQGLLFCQHRQELENVRIFPRRRKTNTCLWFSRNCSSVGKAWMGNVDMRSVFYEASRGLLVQTESMVATMSGLIWCSNFYDAIAAGYWLGNWIDQFERPDGCLCRWKNRWMGRQTYDRQIHTERNDGQMMDGYFFCVMFLLKRYWQTMMRH